MILLRNFLTLQEKLEYLQCAKLQGIDVREKKQLKFEKVSSVSILKILNEFKTYKATGIYNVTRRFLKDTLKVYFW